MAAQSHIQANDRRRNSFDALRFGLAVMVMFSHCYPLAGGRTAPDPFARFLGGAENLGSIAVAGFFAISGFLIASSWTHSRNSFDFAWRRVLKDLSGAHRGDLLLGSCRGPTFLQRAIPVGIRS